MLTKKGGPLCGLAVYSLLELSVLASSLRLDLLSKNVFENTYLLVKEKKQVLCFICHFLYFNIYRF